MILDSSCLFCFAWPGVSSGSDGLYISSLSDMSPATFDCLEPYFLLFFQGQWTKVGIPTPFSDKVGGGKMQTSSPPVITPNRSQSNPDDMISLPRPIQSVGMDLHDVSGTSTGQTLPRERRAPPGTHFCPTIWWVYPHSATIFILHPLLSIFSSTFVRNIPIPLFDSQKAASNASHCCRPGVGLRPAADHPQMVTTPGV